MDQTDEQMNADRRARSLGVTTYGILMAGFMFFVPRQIHMHGLTASMAMALIVTALSLGPSVVTAVIARAAKFSGWTAITALYVVLFNVFSFTLRSILA